MKEREHRPDDHYGKQQVQQAPPGIDHAVQAEDGTNIGAARHQLRCRHRDRVGAEIRFDDFLKYDRQTEGHQDLVGVFPLVEVAYKTTLHRKPDQQHHRYRHENGNWHRIIDDGPADITPPDLEIGCLLVRVKERDAFVLHAHGDGQHVLHADRDKGPQHEDRAMGKIHDAEGAEHQCQAQRYQRIGSTLVQPVQYLEE